MRAKMLAGAVLLGGLISLGSAWDAGAQERNRGARPGDQGRGPRYSEPSRGYRGGSHGRHVQPYRGYSHGYRYAPAPRYYSRPYPRPYYYPYGGYYDPYYYYPYYYSPYSAPAPYSGRPGFGIWFGF